MKKQCNRCIYFDPDLTDRWRESGHCHRHAPAPGFVEQKTAAGVGLLVWWFMREACMADHGLEEATKIADEQVNSFDLSSETYEDLPSASWPKVFYDDWCGDWSLDPRKKPKKHFKKVREQVEKEQAEREKSETKTEPPHEVEQS